MGFFILFEQEGQDDVSGELYADDDHPDEPDVQAEGHGGGYQVHHQTAEAQWTHWPGMLNTSP